MRYKFVCILLILTLLFGGCSSSLNSNSNKPLENDKLLIYTSIYPMYDFTHRIGKENIELKLMVPPGVEPHDWEPSAKMMAELQDADAIIYNGANMEPWIDKILASMGENTRLVETTKGIELLSFKGHTHDDEDHDHGSFDPHVWLDPLRAVEQAKKIKEVLIELDHEKYEVYQSNFTEFESELIALDKKYKEELDRVKKREIIVSHGAFGYLTNRYGLEQISVMGLSPQEEPSAAKLAELTKEAKNHGVTTVFFETLSNPRLSEVLAKEVGARTDVLHPIGGLTQEEIDQNKDYISLMKENLQALIRALEE